MGLGLKDESAIRTFVLGKYLPLLVPAAGIILFCVAASLTAFNAPNAVAACACNIRKKTELFPAPEWCRVVIATVDGATSKGSSFFSYFSGVPRCSWSTLVPEILLSAILVGVLVRVVQSAAGVKK